MTALSDFKGDDLADLLAAPRAVMEGAIVADGAPNALRFLKELTAAAKVFKHAQRDENDFVRAVANRLREEGTGESEGKGLPDPDEAIARAIGTTERAVSLIRSDLDREAYGDWLVRIATEVAEASRSREGGFFSKKVAVSKGERDFIQRLEEAVED
ncbi:hypothetical protein [Glycomyces paridis]|uniref:Uncharacterized protein n=1 Tax=Glycomyces paridis TaxID=2126555 RepID=A0A4S8P0P4_9ACTN|nr:hypothetical protein [Glycomyces paridis]THV22825.1 hypothetical protein E9998_23310 [Glycomyces paridis]